MTVQRNKLEERLVRYVDMLQQWQRAKNLIADSTLQNIRIRHIEDSLQLIRLRSEPMRWLDLGSGAGFPGMIIAMAVASGVGGQVSLVEANGRKCAFLRAVSRETQTSVRIYQSRIEDFRPEITPDIVTARALAPLDKLCGYLAPFWNQEMTALVHKGQDFASEIEKASKYWDFDVIQHPSEVDRTSVILELSNLRKRAL